MENFPAGKEPALADHPHGLANPAQAALSVASGIGWPIWCRTDVGSHPLNGIESEGVTKPSAIRTGASDLMFALDRRKARENPTQIIYVKELRDRGVGAGQKNEPRRQHKRIAARKDRDMAEAMGLPAYRCPKALLWRPTRFFPFADG